ncbi:MAG: CRTAC1 family protein [Candidatus Neomarinimicrobiota bacterium]|nr:CRTAC1 family protein [Candidatus Neomarinimicrobiota bacterium]
MLDKFAQLNRLFYTLLIIMVLLFSCNNRDSTEKISLSQNKSRMTNIEFSDVTTDAGLGNFIHDNGSFGKMWFPEQMGSGGGFIDYNNDGWLDILLIGGGAWKNYTKRNIKTIWLYKNNADGTFANVTDESGLGNISTYGLGVAAADYDNDGDQDIFITTLDRNILLNNNEGYFVNVSKKAGLGNRIEWSSSAIFFDADNDGWLDLYVGNYAIWSPLSDLWCSLDSKTKVYCPPEMYTGLPSKFYHNNGDGTFSDYTTKAGFLPAPGKSLGVVLMDYNNDGWLDLAVANDGERDLLYKNNEGGIFDEIGTELGMAYGENGEARAGMGIDAGVVDSSGNTTIFIGNFSNEMVGVYNYSGKGWFNDRSALSKIGRASFLSLTFGLMLFDVDMDSDLDLFIGNGHVYPERTKNQDGITYKQASQLFLNNGNGVFAIANEKVSGVLNNKMVVRGVALGDYDKDGDIDLLLKENNGPAHLWRNDTEIKNYLRVNLVGVDSNKDAIGSKVLLYVGGYKMERLIRTGSSYLSQSELTATFGLGEHQKIDSLLVYWPSGNKEMYFDIEINKEILIKENFGEIEYLVRN